MAWLKNPTAYLNKLRKEHGDIFILDVFGLKLFFVFSAAGLAEFYQIPETDASFTEATKGFLAQQSLTLRLVLQPVRIEEFTVVPGYYVATLLSCLNTEENLLPGAKEFAPEK